MGGYAPYVWSAFGFAALVLIGLLVQSWYAARRREEELAQLRRLARGRPEGVRRPVRHTGAGAATGRATRSPGGG